MEQNIDVFISHHTKTCLEITEAVCNKLESQGIRVWYAPRNTEDAYARSIVNAIEKCRVFILILNKESSFSEDVLNEINIAVERLRKNDKISILPFHISNDEISNDAKYYIGRMHWIDAITPPMQDRIDELASKVSYLLGSRDENKLETKTSQIKSSVIFSNLNFIGREKEIHEIHEQLKQYGRVFLMGMGGIGKTEIAKKYIQTYQNEYKTILLMKYTSSIKNMIVSNKELYISNFSSIDNETEEEYFIRKLDKLKELTNENTLIVVDNFDTESDEYLEEFLKGEYQVLFTTRNQFEHLGYPVIKIEPFNTIEEQMELFAFYYKRMIKEDEKEDIYQILNLIGGHTLTIELIAKLMSSKRIKPEDMLSTLQKDGISSSLDGTVNHGFSKANTIYGYISLLFDTSKLTKEELDILCNLWMFPKSGINIETFASLCQLNDCFLIDELIKKSWLLYDFYLDKISLHPVIADVISKKYQPNLDSCKILLENLKEQFANWHMDKENKIIYSEIAKSVYAKFPDFKLEDKDFYLSMVTMMNEAASYDDAEEILKKLLNLLDENNIEMKEDRSKAYYELGDICLYRGKQEEACTYFQKALAITRLISPNSREEGYLNKCIALVLIKLEKYDEAEEYLKLSRKIFEEVVDENSFDMGSQYIAEARILMVKKEYEKALALALKAYDIFVLIDKEVGVHAISAMKTLSMIYLNLKENDKAVEFGEKRVKCAEQLHERYHLHVLNAYEGLGDIYKELDDYDKAKENYLVIIEELEKHQEKSSRYYQSIKEKIALLEEKEMSND